jgi:hypothetical protein
MNDPTMNEIWRMLLINFMEMQEIKRRLNISTTSAQDFYDYQNAAHEYLKEHDDKMRSLIKDFPHLWDGKQDQ